MTHLTKEQDAALMAYIDELEAVLRAVVEAWSTPHGPHDPMDEAVERAEALLRKSTEST
jgi:hypothetical protein